MNVHPETQALFAAHEAFARELRSRQDKPSVSVSQAVSFFAFTFERIRNSIDYRDDHLLRRASIARNLTRQFAVQADSKIQAGKLLQELVLARYFPSDHLPQQLAGPIGEILSKYKKVLTGNNSEIRDWFTRIAAVEVDRVLVPPYREDALTNLLFSGLNDSLELPRETDNQRRTRLVYITAARAAVGADSSLVSFLLLNAYYPGWLPNSEQTILEVKQNISEIYQKTSLEINHPAKEPLLRFMARHKAPLFIMQDLAANFSLEEVKAMSPDEVEEQLSRAYRRRLRLSNNRFNRAAVRAIISILLTKMLVLFIIELPLERILLGNVNFRTLALNLTLPPAVLFLLVNAISHPGQRNESRVIEHALKVLESAKLPSEIFIFNPRPRRRFFSFFGGIYASLLALIIVASFLFFLKIGFSVLSTLIMFFFLSLVVFFGFLIREQARELIIEEKEGFLTPLLKFISLPFIRAGRFFSVQIARFNIVIFLVDVLLEAPFKTFFRVAQQAVRYVKERHEEAITQVP